MRAFSPTLPEFERQPRHLRADGEQTANELATYVANYFYCSLVPNVIFLLAALCREPG